MALLLLRLLSIGFAAAKGWPASVSPRGVVLGLVVLGLVHARVEAGRRMKHRYAPLLGGAWLFSHASIAWAKGNWALENCSTGG